MGYWERVKEILSPKAYEDFKSRVPEEYFELRGELGDRIRKEFGDLYPPDSECLLFDGIGSASWLVNFARDKGGMDEELYARLKYEEAVEWSYRFLRAIEKCENAEREDLSEADYIRTKWISHLGHPPAYLVRADMGYPSVQTMYGKYATTMWISIDSFRTKVNWLQGFHNEEGRPVAGWIAAFDEEISQFLDEEDYEVLFGREFMTPPPDLDNIPEVLNRRHRRTGIKLRDIPKENPKASLPMWLDSAHDIVSDMREEMFPDWTHATLFLSPAPGIFALLSQTPFWGISQTWSLIYFGMRAKELSGIPLKFYEIVPKPPIIDTIFQLPFDTVIYRLANMFLPGPKGMLCDVINPIVTPEEKTPLLHEIKELQFEGRMFENFLVGEKKGIPPPRAFFAYLPGAPFYREVPMEELLSGSVYDLSPEFRMMTGIVAGSDLDNYANPSAKDIFRTKTVMDPEIEWLQPKDFPPFDWSEGQIWPIDIDREKMEIMVDEGYDGSGKDILHYSALADKKMGQEGETIMLGTMPYKRPTE